MKKMYRLALPFISALCLCGCSGLGDLFENLFDGFGDEEGDLFEDVTDATENRPEGLPEDLMSGNWDEPAYMEDAALFIVENDEEIGRIQLSAGGRYLILPAGFDNTPEEGTRAASSLTGARRTVTRSMDIEFNGQKMLSGTFTKKGNGLYELEGFGALEVITDDEILVTVDGETRPLQVDCRHFAPNSEVEKQMCSNLWHPLLGRQELYRDDVLLETVVVSSPEELEEEYVKYIYFMIPAVYDDVNWNCRGSFLQIEYDDTIGDIGGWSWVDESKNLMHFDWADEMLQSTDFVQFFLEEADGRRYCYVYEGATFYEDGHKWTLLFYTKCELEEM